MTIKSSIKYIFFVFAIALFVSCDNEANEIGANIVGNDNFELGEPEFYDVLAYNLPIGPVETTNLRSNQGGVNQIGIIDNPAFGRTISHVVAQVKLSEDNLDPINFAREPRIKSVVLTIPYFSHKVSTNSDGTSSYALDSIRGESDGRFNLDIYESTFFLEKDPTNNGIIKKYFSNEVSSFTKGDLLSQNPDFVFNPAEDEEIVDVLSVPTTVKVAPRMKISLDTTKLGPRLFGPAAVGKLLNNNVFTNYFRGLHFNVSPVGSSLGKMASMDFTGGKIIVTYEQYVSVRPVGGAQPQRETKTLTLSLNADNVNLMENSYNANYANILTSPPNNVTGDEKLYVKGGEGSMVVLEMFKDLAKLRALKASKGIWLVNDASISFYVEKNAMNNAKYEPNRIYLYDLDNDKALLDYNTDQSVATNIKYFKKLHGGIIEKDEDKHGVRYKIRITNFIRELIKSPEEKMVRLGLVVTENINYTSNKALKTPIVLDQNGTFDALTIDGVPSMSVANPFGTVLWGSNISPSDTENYDKRVQLTIYYTKPN